MLKDMVLQTHHTSEQHAHLAVWIPKVPRKQLHLIRVHHLLGFISLRSATEFCNYSGCTMLHQRPFIGTCQCAGSRRIALPSPRAVACKSAPRWNPQNTDEPVVVPSPQFSPEQAVQAQLDAAKQNDDPWPNHGIQTLYTWADEAGSMELSGYFVGIRKDLYHLDHFLGACVTRLGALLNLASYQVLESRQLPSSADPDGRPVVAVDVAVKDARGSDAGVFTFTMVQRSIGRLKGCWLTKSVGLKK